MEQVSGSLDVRDATLPEQVDDIHLSDRNVTQAIQLLLIPEDTVDAGTCFELVVPDIVIGLLKVILLQDHRDDGAEHLCLCLVSFLSREDIGRGEVIHSICVFVGNSIEQPAGGRLYLIGLSLSHALPVTELVPLLILYDSLLKVGLAFLVLVQGELCCLDLLSADDLCQSLKAIHNTHGSLLRLCHLHLLHFILCSRTRGRLSSDHLLLKGNCRGILGGSFLLSLHR